MVLKGILLKRGTGSGKEHREEKNETWEQNKELKMKSLIGLLFPVVIFPFPVLVARSALPVSCFSNFPKEMQGRVEKIAKVSSNHNLGLFGKKHKYF